MIEQTQQIKVSIITACYNKGKFISETVNSVLTQTYQNIEYIVVDDASSDDSLHQLKAFAAVDGRMILVRNEENKGANFSRNIGIDKATGSLLILLDADDVLASNCVDNRVQQHLSFPENDLLIFGMGVFYKTTGDDQRQWLPRSKQALPDFLAHNLPWSIVQPMWKTEFMRLLKGFDPTFERLQDVELHTRALLEPNVKFRMFPAFVDCYYRIDEARLVFSKFGLLKKMAIAMNQYVSKFSKQVDKNLRMNLLGTFYEGIVQFSFHRRAGNISKEEYQQLLCLMMENNDMSISRTTLLKIVEGYNLFFPKLPGINKILKAITIR